MDATNNDATPEKRWFPLESNPAMLNRYISHLGFDTHRHEFIDVLGTEPWALAMIPRPVSAVVVLFPMSEKIVRRRRELHAQTASLSTDSTGGNDDVWYMKQRVRNACGTIAILHALANAPPPIRDSCIRNPSWLHYYLQTNPASTSPVDKATALENDATIEQFHEEATNDANNQTSRGNIGDEVDMHFVSFASVGGHLYELDGRVDEVPICHGSTTQENLLSDACKVVRELMEADPTEMRWSILAFAPKSS